MVNKKKKNPVVDDEALQEKIKEMVRSMAGEKEKIEAEDVKEEPSTVTEAPEAEPEVKAEEKKENAELAQIKDMYLRLAADFDNFKKRSANEKTALRGMVIADTVQMMLPILDNLERAVAAAADDNSPLKDGVVMVLNQAKLSFENFGVTAFGERGDKFDPEIHNAVMTCEDGELEPDTIAEVLQKGYKLGDRIIRHAMVKVVSE